MGLAIEVGYLADLLENDEEGAQWFKNDLISLNEFLTSKNLEPHIEPESCEVLSFEMFGYGGIHYLRRVAAHIELKNALPPIIEDYGSNIEEDSVVKEYYAISEGKQGFLDKLFKKESNKRKLSFEHLMQHSDCEGFYLPIDFDSVLLPGKEYSVTGEMVGSSIRLKGECERLAQELNLPLDLDPESEEVWEAANSQGAGDLNWQKYGVESFTCLRLYHAAKHSIDNRAAIVFC